MLQTFAHDIHWWYIPQFHSENTCFSSNIVFLNILISILFSLITLPSLIGQVSNPFSITLNIKLKYNLAFASKEKSLSVKKCNKSQHLFYTNHLQNWQRMELLLIVFLNNISQIFSSFLMISPFSLLIIIFIFLTLTLSLLDSTTPFQPSTSLFKSPSDLLINTKSSV